MKYYDTNDIVDKTVLTQGGRLVKKQYMKTGSGLVPVNFQRDHLNRFHVMPVRYNRSSSARGIMNRVPKVSKAKIMDEISSSLSGMSMRGRGIVSM